MLVKLAIGCLLVVLTTIVHAGFMLGTFRVFRITHVERWGEESAWTRVTVVSGLVVSMLLAALVESALWAGTYLVLGVIDDAQDAMYFSTVTYTTLGYGDLTLEGHWRVLSGIQAANGIIMFGWTTAIIVAAVTRVYFPRPK
jgi:hypothetical protein